MNRLQQLRRRRRLTLRALAAASGLPLTRLHRIERGEDPRVSDLRALARAFGVAAWWKLVA